MAAVICIGRIETSKSMRRHQMYRADIYHAFSLFRVQWAFRKRNGKNLIWPERIIVTIRTVDYIKTALTLLIPVAPKGGFHSLRKSRVLVRRLPKLSGKSSHGLERIEPQRIHLHWFADARRN